LIFGRYTRITPPIRPHLSCGWEAGLGNQARICALQDNTTPLFAAANGGYAGVVRTVIEAGAEVDVKCGDAKKVQAFSVSPPPSESIMLER
jgi:hypothetical protein